MEQHENSLQRKRKADAYNLCIILKWPWFRQFQPTVKGVSFPDGKDKQDKDKHLGKNSSNSGTGHAQSRERANAEDQQRVRNDIADKTACIHDKRCPAVPIDIER
jgi:hypothetical protein